MLQRLLLIALAGAFGTLARYGLGGMVQRYSPEAHLPLGTLVVNVVGCFLFGVVWSLAHERLLIDDEFRVVILVGFMGAFTTFSTFIFETGNFLNDERWLMATVNITVQTLIGLLSLFGGVIVSRSL
jgi:fluoride exporter